jgi:hypothetical protein
MTDVDVNFLARQGNQVVADLAALRTDIAVTIAITRRMKGTTTALLRITTRAARQSLEKTT